MADINYVTYLVGYILTIMLFVVLGCYMLAQRGSVMSTHGELVAKLRMTRTMGVCMFVWAFGTFLYLPPMLYGCHAEHMVYRVLFFVSLMLFTPMIFVDMFAVVQRKVNILNWVCALGSPFLLLAVWCMVNPENYILIKIGATLSIACILFLLVRFVSEYRMYVRRIKSEYSELSHREIIWSWVCFSGLAIQGIIMVVYQLLWSPTLECIYIVLSVVNAVALCFCTCRQVTIDIDVVEDDKGEKEEAEATKTDKDRPKERTFYATIEEKLEMHCEGKLLYLDPDLTREQLCHRLNIGNTYLKMYFHSRGLTFYQYINTLRVEYAYRLMTSNPDLPIGEVSQHSGFRSQTTFRKVFKEIMGCLPSEMKNNGLLNNNPENILQQS